MIKEADFQALIRVFHGAMKEMCDAESYLDRRAVIVEWEDLMNKVNVCAMQMLEEEDPKIRKSVLEEFEQRLKDFGYDKKL